MTIITAKSASNFVAQAKFPKAPVRRRTRGMAAESPIQLKASEAQTMVVGAGLVVAAEKVPVQVREDLINCTLFAQLAASGEVGDPTQVNA